MLPRHVAHEDGFPYLPQKISGDIYFMPNVDQPVSGMNVLPYLTLNNK
jgi:hypothetical protein